jgi:phage gp36-like protein
VPYTTRDTVRDLVSRTVATYPGTAASLSDEQIDTAIESAESLINAKLATGYRVPFPDGSVPVLVVRICNALAAFDSDQTFREVRDYSSELHPVYLRYKEALALLDQLQKGTAVLPDYEPPEDDSGGPDPAGGNIVAVFNPNLCLVDEALRQRRGYDPMCGYYYGP